MIAGAGRLDMRQTRTSEWSMMTVRKIEHAHALPSSVCARDACRHTRSYLQGTSRPRLKTESSKLSSARAASCPRPRQPVMTERPEVHRTRPNFLWLHVQGRQIWARVCRTPRLQPHTTASSLTSHFRRRRWQERATARLQRRRTHLRRASHTCLRQL